MSKDQPTRLERLALELHCPKCEANAGVWCIVSKGWAARLHAARTKPADSIFRAGFRAGVKSAREA